MAMPRVYIGAGLVQNHNLSQHYHDHANQSCRLLKIGGATRPMRHLFQKQHCKCSVNVLLSATFPNSMFSLFMYNLVHFVIIIISVYVYFCCIIKSQ